MKIKAVYKQSIKDAKGAFHSYGLEVEMEVDESNMNGEQKVVKLRSVSHFLHNELHKAIQAGMIADGVPPELTHKDSVPAKVKAKS